MSQTSRSVVEAPAARSQRIALQHISSERSNDPDTILGSMRSHGPMLTAVIEQRPDGQRLTTCRTAEEQREHYETTRAVTEVIDAEVFTSLGSDWYAFAHGSMTVRVFDTGTVRRNEWVGLFPVFSDEDAIAGEIGLSWPPCAKRGDESAVPSTSRAGSVGTAEAWLSAVRGRDANALGSLYSDAALGATRHLSSSEVVPLQGSAAIVSFYEDLLAAFDVVSVDAVARVVDRWFVFTEMAWVLSDREGGVLTQRSGQILVLDDADRIAIDLGYASERVPIETAATSG